MPPDTPNRRRTAKGTPISATRPRDAVGTRAVPPMLVAAAAALADGRIPEPHPDAGKIRILWVFAWLVVGGEETEVRLLAKALDDGSGTPFVLDALEGAPEA